MMLVDNAVGATVTRFLHEQLWDASVRFERTPLLGESAHWLRSLPGRTPQRSSGDVLVSPAPENAFPDLAISFEPDIVIGSSISRPAWREIRSTCQTLNVPTVLYMREETALSHLRPGNGDHDGVFANSKTLVSGAAAIGQRARFFPSIVDVSATQVRSTRERIVLVNPRKEHGVDVVEDLATTFRTIEFVLQESWKLDSTEKRHVDEILSRHPNISFRSRVDEPSQIYRDAAVVLAPHRIDNRPRTILEALSNGIPVVASDLPGLVESVGPGGIIVKRRSGWRDAVGTLWQDPITYRSYEQKARAFASRPEVQSDRIVTSFLSMVSDVIHQHSNSLVGP